MSVLGDVDCYKLNQSDINRAFKKQNSVWWEVESPSSSLLPPRVHPSKLPPPSLFRQGLYTDFLPQNDPPDESGLPFDKTDSMTRLHSNRPATSSFSILILLPVSKGGQGLEFEAKNYRMEKFHKLPLHSQIEERNMNTSVTIFGACYIYI